MSYGTIEYNGFIYKIKDDISSQAVKMLIGDVCCRPYQMIRGEYEQVRYRIKNGVLTLVSAVLYIDKRDFQKVLDTSAVPPRCETVSSLGVFDGKIEKRELYKLIFDRLCLPVVYSGRVETRQVFVDEVYEESGMQHSAISSFIFSEGMLSEAESNIFFSSEKNIDKYTWREDILSAEEAPEKLYYVSPKGSVAQNELLFSAIINYLLRGGLPDSIIDRIMSYREPLLQMEVMLLADPKKRIFERKSYDLVLLCRERNDLELLKK